MMYQFSLKFLPADPSRPLDDRIGVEQWGMVPRVGDLIGFVVENEIEETIIMEVVRVFFDHTHRDWAVVYLRNWDNEV